MSEMEELEPTALVSARIPERLAKILELKAEEKMQKFEEMCGQYIMMGVEYERSKKNEQ